MGMFFPEFTEVETTFTCSADATCHLCREIELNSHRDFLIFFLLVYSKPQK